MKFTPELSFAGGRVRPLEASDIAAIIELYQHPELPGQRPLDPQSEQAQQQIERMIELSVQMAATQRGMMWALEIDGQLLGLVSAYDWQPSALRTMLRVDGLPALQDEHRAAALQVCMDFLASKYHLRNFGYQWVAGQAEAIKTMLQQLGFEHTATLRDGWRCSDNRFADVEQFHLLRSEAKPVPGRLGEQDNPGQNLEKSFHAPGESS